MNSSRRAGLREVCELTPDVFPASAERICGSIPHDVEKTLRELRRTKRGAHCGDLVEASSRLLRERGEAGLCWLILGLYLERASSLLDCAMARAVSQARGVVEGRAETPGSSALARALVECLAEDVNAVNLIREGDPCHPLYAEALLRSRRGGGKRRAAGRVAALMEECMHLCADEDKRVELSEVLDKIAEVGDEVLEKLEKEAIPVLREMCVKKLRKENPAFCEIIEKEG